MLSMAAGTQPLREVLHWGTTTLAEAGLDMPRLDAEVLLAVVLDCSRAQVLARLHEPLGRTNRIAYRGLILRRAQGEPVAYITGRKEFYGREFVVNRRVLIPRPETELLVERALAVLSGLENPLIADVGTGSGNIAITLAAERSDLRAIAIDVSAGALAVARENAERHDVADRITFLHDTLLTGLKSRVDLITANLPYVGCEEAGQLPRDVIDYEPHQALFAGDDGLSLIRGLFDQIEPARLAPAGTMLLEIGYGHGAAVVELAERRFPNGDIRLYQDPAGYDRLVEIHIGSG